MTCAPPMDAVAHAMVVRSMFTHGSCFAIMRKDVSVPNNTNVTMMQAMFTPAVVVPAGSRLVVEIFAGDRMPLGAGNYFFPGSNALGETGASYIYSMVCGVNDPTKYAVITTPDPAVHLVMSVQGTVP